MASGGSSRRNNADDDDLANVEFETSEDVEVIPTFDSMGLREDLLRGVYAYGKISPESLLFKFCKRALSITLAKSH
jgi:ATP-dependent RNA helicase